MPPLENRGDDAPPLPNGVLPNGVLHLPEDEDDNNGDNAIVPNNVLNNGYLHGPQGVNIGHDVDIGADDDNVNHIFIHSDENIVNDIMEDEIGLIAITQNSSFNDLFTELNARYDLINRFGNMFEIVLHSDDWNGTLTEAHQDEIDNYSWEQFFEEGLTIDINLH